jgi:hypothetical protein
VRIFFYAASVSVLTAVVPLFVFPTKTDVAFAWTIEPPSTAAFLGAGYLAACFLEFGSARERAWSRARLGMTGVLTFTVLTLVATLLHLDRFHFHDVHSAAHFSAWAWLNLYIFTPVVIVVLLALQLRVRGGDEPTRLPMSMWARVLLGAESLVLLSVGLLLFIAPVRFASIWPWALTPLTARAVASWLISVGFVAAWAVREGDVDRPPAIAAFLVLGVVELVALARFRGDVDWGRPSAWLYLGFLIVMVITGVFATSLIVRARRSTPAAPPAREVVMGQPTSS